MSPGVAPLLQHTWSRVTIKGTRLLLKIPAAFSFSKGITDDSQAVSPFPRGPSKH